MPNKLPAMGEMKLSSAVNHPQHYNASPSGIEAIDVLEHMNFNLGNAMKYIWRAGHKGNLLQDLEKAKWCLDREIKRLTKAKSLEEEVIKLKIDPQDLCYPAESINHPH